jgi:hypothetical protein
MAGAAQAADHVKSFNLLQPASASAALRALLDLTAD